MGFIQTLSSSDDGAQKITKWKTFLYNEEFSSQSTRKIHLHRTESSMRIILSSRFESRLSQWRSILTLRRDKQEGNGDIR